MAKKKFYAVRKGYKTGVFLTWTECSKQISGYKGILGGEGIWYSAILAEGTCMIVAIVLFKTKIKAVYNDMKSPKSKKEKLNECY